MANQNREITVKADPNLDDCLQGAADAYVEDHPDLKGWDLSPRWGDEDRETVVLTVPAWALEEEVEEKIVPYINFAVEAFFDDLKNNGWRHRLVFDPRDGEISVYSAIGAGTPVDVYHGICESWHLPACTGESLKDFVEENMGLFEDLLEAYKGTEWDGHNNVGRWSEGAEDVDQAIQQALERHEFEGRWLAADWLGADMRQTESEIAALLLEGKTTREITEYFVLEAKGQDAVLDPADVLDFVEARLEDEDAEKIRRPLEDAIRALADQDFAGDDEPAWTDERDADAEIRAWRDAAKDVLAGISRRVGRRPPLSDAGIVRAIEVLGAERTAEVYAERREEIEPSFVVWGEGPTRISAIVAADDSDPDAWAAAPAEWTQEGERWAVIVSGVEECDLNTDPAVRGYSRLS